jgi:hypothetical protein
MARVMGDDRGNPFSTRFVRPGAMEYLFLPGFDAEKLVEQFAHQGWRGEIVGPHGSGKSTLLAALLPLVEARGWRVHRVDLHDGERWLPRGWREAFDGANVLLVVDGYEQLGAFERWRVRRLTKGSTRGLLVTAHTSVGLPRLWTTEVDAVRAQMVFECLAPDARFVSPEDLDAALGRHPTDLRSALFELYDLYERRRREAEADA